MSTEDRVTEDIKDLIKKHMPAVAAEEFAKFVEEATETKKKLEKLELKNISLQKTIQEKEENIEKFVSLKLDSDNIAKREKEVKEREDKLTIDNLTLQLKESEKRNQVVEGLVSKVFSNQTLITSLTRSRSGIDQHGHSINDFETEDSKTKVEEIP